MTRALRFLTDNDTAVAEAPPPSGSTELESDLVVILASLLCAVVCLVGFIVVSRCSWLRLGTGNSPAQAVANKGLKKKVLQSLPKFTYMDSNPSKWLAMPECAICLSEFAAGDEIRVLPQCGHGFHVGCIDTWLKSHSSCPSCRQVLAAAARCQKCGRFPAVGGGSDSTTNGAEVNETEMKSREDNNGGVSNNNNSSSSSVSSCSNMVGHHSHDSSNFLS